MNQREIKFRAWHLGIEKWCVLDLTDISMAGYFEEWGMYKNISQYTGIKDKHGNEIYEGDILGSERKDNIMINTVVFGHSGFCHLWHNKVTSNLRGRSIEPLFTNLDIVFSVIGNIYEHPHLLENGIISPLKTKEDE